jgi:sulfate adenylyltransferase subunit 2
VGRAWTRRDPDRAPLHYAAPQSLVERDGTLITVEDDRTVLKPSELPELRSFRFRTLGC